MPSAIRQKLKMPKNIGFDLKHFSTSCQKSADINPHARSVIIKLVCEGIHTAPVEQLQGVQRSIPLLSNFSPVEEHLRFIKSCLRIKILTEFLAYS